MKCKKASKMHFGTRSAASTSVDICLFGSHNFLLLSFYLHAPAALLLCGCKGHRCFVLCATVLSRSSQTVHVIANGFQSFQECEVAQCGSKEEEYPLKPATQHTCGTSFFGFSMSFSNSIFNFACST